MIPYTCSTNGKFKPNSGCPCDPCQALQKRHDIFISWSGLRPLVKVVGAIGVGKRFTSGRTSLPRGKKRICPVTLAPFMGVTVTCFQPVRGAYENDPIGTRGWFTS